MVNENTEDLSDYIVELNQDSAVIIVKFFRGSYKDAREFNNVLTQIIDDGFQKIIIDFQHVDFIDSTFLGTLVIGLKKIRNAGGKINIINLNHSVYRIFEFTGFIKYLSPIESD